MRKQDPGNLIAIADDLHIIGVVSCVGYSDFLRFTLPLNSKQLDRVIVLSDHHDYSTHEICASYPNVSCIPTDVWYTPIDGTPAAFNKGRGLNVGLDEINNYLQDSWICVLDADIILPIDFRLSLNLSIDTLYSCRRRMCVRRSNYSECWDKFKLDPLPTFSPDTGLWGNAKIRTSNVAGLYGYMQMWSSSIAARFPTQFGSAHSYDVRFGMGWPDENRRWLSCDVLHLGSPRKNWNGRVTPEW